MTRQRWNKSLIFYSKNYPMLVKSHASRSQPWDRKHGYAFHVEGRPMEIRLEYLYFHYYFRLDITDAIQLYSKILWFFAVETKSLPPAIEGRDVLCQSGTETGQIEMQIIAVLQQLKPVEGEASALFLCTTREQTTNHEQRVKLLSKYLENIKVSCLLRIRILSLNYFPYSH